MSQARSVEKRRRLQRLAPVLAAMMLACLVAPELAAAQSWWPFGGSDDKPPVPREPVYREPPADIQAPPPQQAPVPPPSPGVPAAPNAPASPGAPAPSASTNWSTKNPICYQLEQRLVQEGQKGSQSRDELTRLEDQIRVEDQAYNQGQTQLDKSCYEYFLFAKTLRNTPKCVDIERQVEASKRRLADLEARRQNIVGTSGRSYQDDIIRELARNNCGANYVDMARRRNDGMWQDEESSGGNTWSPFASNGAQTYRTLCVRLCDGFYFPVSFSTLPSHFSQDADVCSAKCAAPTELYYYPNPGGTVEQSVALKTQEAYTKLKYAFRYRKEYVSGCSCKTAEYVPPDGTVDKKAENAQPRPGQPPRRAEVGPPAQMTTGSTAAQTNATPGDNGGWQTQAQPQ